MKRTLLTLAVLLLSGTVANTGRTAATGADGAVQGNDSMRARHGGVVSITKAHAFETVLAPHGVRVYIYTDEHAPAMIEKAAGQATLTLPDGKTVTVALIKEVPGDKEPATYFCPMHAEVVQDRPGECEPCGGMKLYKQDRLSAQVDLSKADLQQVKVAIRVSGMRGAEKEATFTPAFREPDRKAPGVQSGEAAPKSEGEAK